MDFRKPQYLTSNGLVRRSAKPAPGRADLLNLLEARRPPALKKTVISEDAARKIAQAIRGMLRKP